MKFTYITLFPHLIEHYFDDSILKRAADANLLQYEFYNPRDYTKNKHLKVDDSVVGGGAGMLMTPQPLFDTLNKVIENNRHSHIIFPLAAAKPFTQNDAKRLAKKENVVFVSGRYEGIDERVIETYADEVFSIGDYILTGGELPSLVISDAIARNIPGVLGNQDSLAEESYEQSTRQKPFLEAPAFAKPKEFRNLSVVSEYLKGNHGKICDLKTKLAMCKTQYYRPRRGKNYEK